MKRYRSRKNKEVQPKWYLKKRNGFEFYTTEPSGKHNYKYYGNGEVANGKEDRKSVV